MKRILFVFIVLLTLLISSCEDSSIVGNNLLDDEKFNIEYSETISIKAKTIASPERYSFVRGRAVYAHLAGKMNDPIFGESSASVYTRMTYLNFAPSFSDVVLDSAVMIMAYDTAAYFGNPNAVHRLEITEIIDDFALFDTIKGPTNFNVSPKIIGSKEFIANFSDSISILSHDDTSAIKVPAQIRVRLDDEWANSFIKNPLFEDENLNGIDTALYGILKGFRIENLTTDNAMLGLDFNSSSTTQNSVNSVVFYVSSSDGKKGFYNFSLSGGKFNQGEINYTGSEVGNSLNDITKGAQYTYIQSFGGSSVSLDFDDLNLLDDKIVNQAILELTVANLPGDDLELYPPVSQLLAVEVDNETGNWNLIPDAQILFTLIATDLSAGFGGSLQKNSTTNTQFYQINITNWLKQKLKDPSASRNLIITSNLPSAVFNVRTPIIPNERLNRSVIFGPNNAEHPLKLKVTYTNQ